MADQIAIPGEFCTFVIGTPPQAIAATRTFTMNLDAATYGNFVARGTSYWRTNYVADLGGTFDVDGLIVVQDVVPVGPQQFDDLFTLFANRTMFAVVFTLREKVFVESFVYSCNCYLTSLATTAPVFGETTYTASMIITGPVKQWLGTVSS